jgi:hypothetical protein
MMAAAFLYNVTGDQTYEAVIQSESLCTTANSAILNTKSQIWGTAAYLMTPQPIHFQTLWNNMKASVIAQAKAETGNIDTRPSRRSTNETDDVLPHHPERAPHLIAHAVTTDATDKALFRKALGLEADWSLGRNPLNMIEMGTAYTGLAAKRSVNYMYTWGSNDNLPGSGPGANAVSEPGRLEHHGPCPNRPRCTRTPTRRTSRTPGPSAKATSTRPFVWAHSEYTPQQTMRGKMALYGYLYGINHGSGATGGAGGSGGTSGGGGVGGNGGVGGSGGAASSSSAVGSGGASGRGGMSGGGGFTGAGGTLGSGGVLAVAGSAGGGGVSAVAGSAGGGGVSAVAGSAGGGGVLATGGEVGGRTAGAGGVSAAGGAASGGMGGSSGSTKAQASGCTCATHPGRPVGPVSWLALPALLLWRRRNRHRSVGA